MKDKEKDKEKDKQKDHRNNVKRKNSIELEDLIHLKKTAKKLVDLL